MSEDVYTFHPDQRMFQTTAKDTTEQVMREPTVQFIFHHLGVSRKHGWLLYYQGIPYPEKGMKSPDAGLAIAIAKKLFLGILEAASTKSIILPAIGFLFLPWKHKIKLIDRFLTRYAESVSYLMIRHFPLKVFYSPVARGVRQISHLFLKNLGFSQPAYYWLSQLVACFLIYDDMYRYRVQDIFTMANKQRLIGKPRKELLYLFNIYQKREHADPRKLGTIKVLLSIALLIPKIKRAFTEAVRHVDIDKMKYDYGDMYHTLLKGRYDFMGWPVDYRKKTFMQIHGGKIPPIMQIQYVD